MNNNWMSPEGKEKLIREVFGDKLPYYQWFCLGEKRLLSNEEHQNVNTLLFFPRRSERVEIELHLEERLPNRPTAMRVKNAERVQLTILLGSTVCPLYAVGDKADPRKLNFYELSQATDLKTALLGATERPDALF